MEEWAQACLTCQAYLKGQWIFTGLHDAGNISISTCITDKIS